MKKIILTLCLIFLPLTSFAAYGTSDTFCATGFGTANVNGSYAYDNDVVGMHFYKNTTADWWMFSPGNSETGYGQINQTHNDGTQAYGNSGNGLVGTWSFDNSGQGAIAPGGTTVTGLCVTGGGGTVATTSTSTGPIYAFSALALSMIAAVVGVPLAGFCRTIITGIRGPR